MIAASSSPRARSAALSATFVLLLASPSCGEKGSPSGAGGASSTSTGSSGGAGGSLPVDPCPKGGQGPISATAAPVAPLKLPGNRTPLTVVASSPQSSVFTYAWSQASGPAGARLHHADQAEATVVGLKEGAYSFEVTVKDGCGISTSAQVAVAVAAADPLPATGLGQIAWTPSPVFAEKHTLPPLTYASCTFTSDPQFTFETALVEKYGYAYSLHRAEKYWDDQLALPGSDIARKVAKHKGDPRRYPLSTSVIRPLWSQEEGRGVSFAEYLDASLPGRCAGCAPALLTADSTVPGDVHFSPAADPAFYDLIGADTAAWIKPYADAGASLAVVLNLAEDGVELSAGSCGGHHWDDDPVIVADFKKVMGVGSAPPCGDGAWAVYVSKRIARLNQRVTDAVVAALPAGSLYLRYRTEGNMNRGRYGSWYDYAPFYEDTKANASLPNGSLYYDSTEPPYPQWDKSAWDPNTDMLTGTLAAAAWQIKLGSPLAYNWVSGGWTTDQHGLISPVDRYMGYLKALYLTGNIGAVATWWTGGIFDDGCDPEKPLADPSKLPPAVEQMVALGEVHALFSHFEDFLRGGALVPGPALHRFTTKAPAEQQIPAYELVCPTPGEPCDRRLRVLARRHGSKQAWLIVAWAAYDADTEVTVSVPDLGSVKVNARAGGSLYLATLEGGAPKLELIDEDPLHPTDLLLP
jgi:hypothetical protein